MLGTLTTVYLPGGVELVHEGAKDIGAGLSSRKRSQGTMLTGMVPPGDEVVKMLDNLQPIGYTARPEEMAAGILFLFLIIDGAATAGRAAISG